MQAHLEKLRAETTNCERIAKLATDTEARLVYQACPALQDFGLRGGARDQECNQEQ